MSRPDFEHQSAGGTDFTVDGAVLRTGGLQFSMGYSHEGHGIVLPPEKCRELIAHIEAVLDEAEQARARDRDRGGNA